MSLNVECIKYLLHVCIMFVVLQQTHNTIQFKIAFYNKFVFVKDL